MSAPPTPASSTGSLHQHLTRPAEADRGHTGTGRRHRARRRSLSDALRRPLRRLGHGAGEGGKKLPHLTAGCRAEWKDTTPRSRPRTGTRPRYLCLDQLTGNDFKPQGIGGTGCGPRLPMGTDLPASGTSWSSAPTPAPRRRACGSRTPPRLNRRHQVDGHRLRPRGSTSRWNWFGWSGTDRLRRPELPRQRPGLGRPVPVLLQPRAACGCTTPTI